MKKVLLSLSLLSVLISCRGGIFPTVRSGPPPPGKYLVQLQTRDVNCGELPVGAYNTVKVIIPEGLELDADQTRQGGAFIDGKPFDVRLEDEWVLLYKEQVGHDEDGTFTYQEGYSMYRVEGLTDVLSGSGTVELKINDEVDCYISMTLVGEAYHGR